MADYKIQLGVQLDTKDLNRQIDAASTTAKPIQLKADTDILKNQIKNIKFNKINLEFNQNTLSHEIAELKKKIQKELKIDLGNGVKGKIGADVLSISSTDVSRITQSFESLESSIKDIRVALGTLDDDKGMKSLLASINEINSSLKETRVQFEALSKSFSGMNFNINLGSGKNPIAANAAYGQKVRNETLPQLREQYRLIAEEIKRTQKLTSDWESVALKSAFKGAGVGGADVMGLANDIGDKSLSKQMNAYKQLIALMQKAASMDGINLSNVTSGFKSPDALIDEAQRIQSGLDQVGNQAEETKQKLKDIFGSGIDSERLDGQLDSIVANLNEIKTVIQGLTSGVSLDGLTQSFDRLSNTIDSLINNIGNIKVVLDNSFDGVTSGAKEAAQAVEQTADAIKEVNQASSNGSFASGTSIIVNDFKEINAEVDSVENNLDSFRAALKSAGLSGNSIDSVVKKFEELGVSVKGVSSRLDKNGGFTLTVKGTNDVEEAVKVIAKLPKGKETFEYDIKIDDDIGKIRDKLKFNDLNFSDFDKEIGDVTSRFKNLSVQSDNLRIDIEALNSAFNKIQVADNANDIKALVRANKEYEDILKRIKSQLEINEEAQRKILSTEKLRQNSDILSVKMGNWIRDNSAAAKQFEAQIRKLQAELKSCDDVRFNGIKKEFEEIRVRAQAAGKTGLTFFDRLKTQFSKYSAYFGVAELFMYAEQGLRDMFEQVKAIDSAMTELKKVTDETDASYNRFLSNAADRAREIGTTIDGLVESTADFARLGYGFKDAQGLAEVANIYAVVGDEVEGVEGATQSLISTMAAFKDEMNGLNNTDFAMSLIDKMNEVGNNFAISSGGIGEALQRSASSMAAANNTIDETIALITAANTVVQNPERIGNGLKTISMRIRGAKSELEEAGESTDDMAESTASLRAEIMALSGVDIMLNENTFKSTYQIIDELSQKWEGLSDIAQASITELLAGGICLPEYVEIHI